MTDSTRLAFSGPAARRHLALALLAAASATAQDLVPLGPEQLVNTMQTGWQQEWGKVAVADDGEAFAVAWSTSLGSGDVMLRLYDADGLPATDEILVNDGLGRYIQDEPMLAMDGAGHVLVCWSDRNGYDGELMGCFGRVFDASGTPLGPGFQINASGSASHWEPMPAATPGGWVVAFNGGRDGGASLRWLATDGTPLTGDVLFDTLESDGQAEAECAPLADGTVLAVYADFGGHVAPDTGTNLLARRLSPAGVPLESEFVVNDGTLDFDQLEPRVAASRIGYGFGTWVVVWEDWGHDGDGAGIWARRYGSDGTALGPAWPVHETTAGDQVLPEVACDWIGNFVVTWEDRSTGTGRIVARCYDALGRPRGAEFEVSGGAGSYRRPQVAMDDTGETVVFAYSGPPGDAVPSNTEDVWVRRFRFAPVTVEGAPAVGRTFDLALDLPGADGQDLVVVASFGSDEGLLLPDGRVMDVDLDPLLEHALLSPDDGLPFVGLQGVLGTPPEATASVVVPPNPQLVGLPMVFGAITLDLDVTGLALQLRHVTGTVGVVLE